MPLFLGEDMFIDGVTCSLDMQVATHLWTLQVPIWHTAPYLCPRFPPALPFKSYHVNGS